jgi:hypothetical protein
MAGETLKVTAGNATGQDIPLEQELVIGRSTPGAGSLGGDSEISRVHARVFRDASGQLTVEDLGSTNGTFVNGNRIGAPTPLRPGDEVRFGQTTLSVEGGAAAEGATAVGQPIPPAVAAPPPATSAMPAPPQTPSRPSSSGYPPGFVGKLIQGCDKSGKLTHSQCVCWFNKLKNAYTFPELVTVLKKARGGSIPPKAVALLRTCLNQ